MKLLSRQRGAAIIVALFVVALVAIASTIMIERLRSDIRRTELVLNSNTTYHYAQGSILWAMDQLNNDWKNQKPDQLIDKTPIQSPVDKQNGATISSIIYDAQGFFNINNLTDQHNLINFIRLIQAVAPETDGGTAQNITLAIADWISQNAKNSALDEYYLKSNPSYQAPHRPMVSISELRLVKDVTPELYTKLLPFLIALPHATPININNALAPVLISLSPTMTIETAQNMVKGIAQKPYLTAQSFLDSEFVKNNPVEPNKITVASSYFLVKTNVTLGRQTLILYTLLERVAQSSQSTISILWQSKTL